MICKPVNSGKYKCMRFHNHVGPILSSNYRMYMYILYICLHPKRAYLAFTVSALHLLRSQSRRNRAMGDKWVQNSQYSTPWLEAKSSPPKGHGLLTAAPELSNISPLSAQCLSNFCPISPQCLPNVPIFENK